MTRPIQLDALTSKPGPGFDDPFGMLHACHDRLRRMLALLDRLRAHLPQHGADDQARQAAGDVMRYFDQAAPQHHRDEELHVFPPLLAGADAQLVGVVRRLQQDHVRMESGWERARAVLARIAAGDASLQPGDAEALDELASLYASHVEAEEQLAYPAALAVLGDKAIAAMGGEMASRRGIR